MSAADADHLGVKAQKLRRPSAWILLVVYLGPAVGFLAGEPFAHGPASHTEGWVATAFFIGGCTVGVAALACYCVLWWRAGQKRKCDR
jgi:hypothetical protein